MRLLFMGTPDFAVPTLAEIVGQGHEVVAVYTRAPAPAGRGMALRPSPVAALAARFGIPVETPKSLRGEEEQRTFRAFAPDICVVVAYGLLLPKPILDAPPLGCLNLHASLLPRWRGAAPIHRAIMAGDTETGVMVMRMEEGLDTGPVAMVEKTPIGPDETTGDLHDRLKIVGADLMARALAAAGRGSLIFTPQAETGVTYAHKIGNDEAELDFTLPAQIVHDHIRGLSPFPGAFIQARLAKGPERVKVLRSVRAEGEGPPGTLLDSTGRVACREGAIRLVTVQRAGGKPMTGEEFLRGAGLSPGATIV